MGPSTLSICCKYYLVTVVVVTYEKCSGQADPLAELPYFGWLGHIREAAHPPRRLGCSQHLDRVAGLVMHALWQYSQRSRLLQQLLQPFGAGSWFDFGVLSISFEAPQALCSFPERRGGCYRSAS